MLKQTRHSPDAHATRFDTKPVQRNLAWLIVAVVLAVVVGAAWLYGGTNQFDDVHDTGSFPSSMEGLERD